MKRFFLLERSNLVGGIIVPYGVGKAQEQQQQEIPDTGGPRVQLA